MNAERKKATLEIIGGVISLIVSASVVIWFVGDGKKPPLHTSNEYGKWYELGRSTGVPLGRDHARTRRSVPRAEDLAAAATGLRNSAGITDVHHATAYDRGFASGFQEGFRAYAKPAW